MVAVNKSKLKAYGSHLQFKRCCAQDEEKNKAEEA
jgi:hypothetical protein